jgi:hypothetical protein
VDHAIKAAIDGCAFYEWLLDFVIRSRPRDLLGTERFFLQLESLPGSLTDVHSVKFMIGTERYMWPCACFDVFTDEGQLHEIVHYIAEYAKKARKCCSALH